MYLTILFWVVIIFTVAWIVGHGLWAWISSVFDATAQSFVGMGWMFDDSLFGGSVVKPKPKLYGLEADAIDRIDALMREVVKARYCDKVLDNPPMDEEMMDKRMEILRKLERVWPKHAKKYSPTRYYGYVEERAIDVYGEKDWYELKRTLSLTMPDSPLDDHYLEAT